MKENEKKLTAYQQEQIDTINWEADFKKKVEEELLANEKAMKYLQQFEEKSVKDFITGYVGDKTRWYRFGESTLQRKDRHDLKWIEAADEHLEIIQQKKLFDLQCLWRAEQITLPGVEICFDFEILGDDVLNCPFVDPVTEEDIELYQEYLLREDADLMDSIYGNYCEWQAYDEIKEADQTNELEFEMPQWYHFHNNRRGTGTYLLLPDIRGEKEEFYRDIARKARDREIDAAPKTPEAPKDKRPRISNYEDTAAFVNNCEDNLTKEYCKAFQWVEDNMNNAEQYNDMLEELLGAEEMIPMIADVDWKEGLRKTVRRYRAQKMSDALSEAFEQYQMNRSMNIAFPIKRKQYFGLRGDFAKLVLKGRVLNGEPEDLNF